jgi:hypothetical protein
MSLNICQSLFCMADAFSLRSSLTHKDGGVKQKGVQAESVRFRHRLTVTLMPDFAWEGATFIIGASMAVDGGRLARLRSRRSDGSWNGDLT